LPAEHVGQTYAKGRRTAHAKQLASRHTVASSAIWPSRDDKHGIVPG
jgi:hypothetical protein